MTDLNIINIPLSDGEYVNSRVNKDTIYLHHTAGGHRADWTVKAWDKDRSKNGKRWRIATAYTIGGISTRDFNTEWDGKIVQAFDDDLWAYHLKAKRKYKIDLDPKSIGIEICNYGPLTRSSSGEFFNWVGSRVPKELVYENSDGFRGYSYWHKYTDAQLESARTLLLHLSDKHEIDLSAGMNEMFRYQPSMPLGLEDNILELQKWLRYNDYMGSNGKPIIADGITGANTRGALDKATKGAFDVQDSALYGQPGLWTHVNCRTDKTDCHPQPELIQMIKSL